MWSNRQNSPSRWCPISFLSDQLFITRCVKAYPTCWNIVKNIKFLSYKPACGLFTVKKRHIRYLWEQKERENTEKIMNGRLLRSAYHPINSWPVCDISASSIDWDFCCFVVWKYVKQIKVYCSYRNRGAWLHRIVGNQFQAFPYGNGMVLHFYQQQESSTTKTVHKVINKGLKAYV